MTPGDGLPPQGTAEKKLGEIVSEVSEKASLLVREEIELAKAEVTDKVGKLGKGAGIGAAAAVFLIFGVTMFFHFLAWFLDDLFNWSSIWPGFGIVALLLFLLAAVSGLIAKRLFEKGKTLTPDLAIEEAKRTRAQLEAQLVERDQVKRTLDAGEEGTR
jgi:Putative Actinobacterial Holin-X, holin superfamily III